MARVPKLSADERRELISLLQRRHGSKAAALDVLNGLEPAGLRAVLHDLRLWAVEKDGQQRLPLVPPAAVASPAATPAGRAKKVPYSVLLTPSQLDELRALADRDGSSVSHHIRAAIRDYLKRGVR